MKKLLLGFAAAMFAFAAIADYVPLANTVRKLKTNKALKVAVVGDSLAYGQICNGGNVLGVSYASRITANSSGMPKANPMSYARIFTDMVKREAKSRFDVADANIDTFYSVWGGATTKTTYGYFAHDIAARRPDLLLIEIWNKDSNGENLCYAEGILRTMWQVSPETDILLFSAGECFSLDDIKVSLVNKYKTPYFELYTPVYNHFCQFGNFFNGGKCVFQPDGKLTGTCSFFYGNGFPHTTEEGYIAYSDGLSTNLKSLLDAAAESTGDCERVPPAGSLEDDPLPVTKGVYPGHAYIVSPASLVAAGVVDSNWTATVDEVSDEPRDTADRATGDKLTATAANATITTNVVGRFLFFRGCKNMQVSVSGGAYQAISDGKYINLTTEANDVTNSITLKATSKDAYINEFYVYGAATNDIPAVATKHRYSVSYFARVADLHYHDWHIGDQQIIEHPITWLNVFRDETYDTDLTVPGESVIASDCEKNGTFLGWVEPDSVTWQGSERKFTVNTHDGKKIYAAGDTIMASDLTGDMVLVAAYSDGPVAAECDRTFKASFMPDTTDSATNILLTEVPTNSPSLTLPEVPAKPGYIAHGWREVLGATTLTAGSVYSLTNDTEFIAVYEFDRNNETGLTFAGKNVTVNYLLRNGSLRECFDAQLSGTKMGEYTSGSDEEGWNFECNMQYHFVTKTDDNYVKAKVAKSSTYYKDPTFYGTAGIPVKMSQLKEVAVAYRYEPTNTSSPGLAGEHLNIKLIAIAADGLSKISLTAQSKETVLAGDNVAHFDISTAAGYTNLVDVIEIKFYDTINGTKFNTDNAFAVGPVTYTTKLVEKENAYRGLPNGYKQVEFIKSDKSQWIDTGVKGTTNLTVTMDFIPVYDWNCIYMGDADGKMRLTAGSSTSMNLSYFGTAKYITSIPMGTRYTVKLGKYEEGKSFVGVYDVDGVKLSLQSWGTSTSAADTTSLGLFGTSTGGGAIVLTLYGCKITEDATVLRDFVPAVRTSDTKPGLYDVQNDVFYTNANASAATDFTWGNNVNGIVATVTKSVDVDNGEITVSFDVTSGSGDLYVTELRGGLPVEHLVKSGAQAGEQYQYTLDLSTISEGTSIGYKTVVDGEVFTAESLTEPFSLTPAGSVSVSEYDATNATLTATITSVGDLSKSADVYLAYAKSGTELPAPTVWETGLAVCTTNINLLSLSPDTAYNYEVVYTNNRARSAIFTGSFKTNPQTGIPVVDDDPNDTEGSVRYRNLPATYTQLESLTSNGKQYILPDISSSDKLSITVDSTYPSGYNQTIVGDVSGSWNLAAYNSSVYFQLTGYLYTFYCNLTSGNRYTFVAGQREAGGQLLYVYDSEGGSVYQKDDAKVTPTISSLPIGIFGHGDGTQPSTMTLYSVLMREDGVLKRDLVPAVSSGGEYGLYDVVYSNFYTSSTAFVAASQGAAVPGVSVEPTLTYESGKWKLSLKVVTGTGDIYATETDVATGVHQKILLKVGATVGDVLEYTYQDIAENKFYSLGYMWNQPDQNLKQYYTVRSFFNGSVEIAKTADADEGTAASGKFTVSISGGATTASDLAVNYTVDPSSTAVAGQTYFALPGVVTIPAGTNSVDIEVVPLWDPSTTVDTMVVLKLAEGDYRIGTSTAQTLTIENGERYGGWLYDAASSVITNFNDGWSFAATDLGSQKLRVGAVKTGSGALDLSTPIVATNGVSSKRYTISELVGCFSSATSTYYDAATLLTSLKLPTSGLTKIGDYTFNGCTALASVEPLLPDSVTTLGTYAFVDCPFSQPMSMKGVTALTQKYSVKGCGITLLYIGPDFKTLGGGWGSPTVCCTALTNITFDAGITNAQSQYSYSERSFMGCTAVVGTVDFSGFSTLPKYPFADTNAKITEIILGQGVSSAKTGLFNGINASTFKSIVFTGNPPDGIDSEMTSLSAKTTIKTCIKPEFKDAWTTYAEGGVIPGTWASSYLPSGVTAAQRPICFSTEKRGLLLFVK